jgi:hypothetical protein
VKVFACFGASLLIALALAAPAPALDRGSPDGGRHQAVGILAWHAADATPPAWNMLCSGFAVSDRVFVSAAHCIEALPGVGWGATLASGSPGRPVVTGTFPDDFPLFPVSARVAPAVAVVVHPSADVAVLRFAPGTFAHVKPIALPPTGLLDALAASGGLQRQRFTLVGYGLDPETDGGEVRFATPGYRQWGIAGFDALEAEHLVLRPWRVGWRHGANACLGDSGSPQLLGHSDIAVSLMHEHGDDCAPPTIGQRLDLPEVKRFLEGFLR